MYSEDSIRSRTEDILVAYRSITGGTVYVTIDEFLHARAAAVAELRQGIGFPQGEGKPAPGPVRAEHERIPARAAGTEEEREASPGRPAVRVETESQEQKASDMDILRCLDDPWNE